MVTQIDANAVNVTSHLPPPRKWLVDRLSAAATVTAIAVHLRQPTFQFRCRRPPFHSRQTAEVETVAGKPRPFTKSTGTAPGRQTVGVMLMAWKHLRQEQSELAQKIRDRWIELSDEDIAYIESYRDRLIERLVDRYQMIPAQVISQVSKWENKLVLPSNCTKLKPRAESSRVAKKLSKTRSSTST